MFRSIKYQFSFIISVVIIVLFAGVATFLVVQETNRSTSAILTDAYSFAEFSGDDVVQNYAENLAEVGNYNKFDSEMKRVLRLNGAIDNIMITNYTGEIMYDPSLPSEEQTRFGENMNYATVGTEMMDRIKSKKPSIQTDKGVVYFLSKTSDGEMEYFDHNDQPTEAPEATTRINNFVQPQNDDLILVYNISYQKLDQSLRSTITWTLVGIAIAVVIAVIVAFYLSGKIAAPLTNLTRYVKIILKSDERKKLNVKSQNEIGQLATSFNEMVDDLNDYEEQLVQKERMETELRLAADIQEDIIPKNIPQIKGIEMAATVNPAAEIGGDCYDFFPIDNDGKMLFYIGDVTGHGVPAGLVVSVANAIFYQFSRETESPVEMLNKANHILHKKTKSNMFLTAMTCLYEKNSNKLTYASAGHEPILHFVKKTGKVEERPAGGMALGMIGDISAITKMQSMEMESGDVIVLFTDGIPEAWGPVPEDHNPTETEIKQGHSFYGMEKFRESVESHANNGESAHRIMENIIKDVREFTSDVPVQDDITLIVIKKK